MFDAETKELFDVLSKINDKKKKEFLNLLRYYFVNERLINSINSLNALEQSNVIKYIKDFLLPSSLNHLNDIKEIFKYLTVENKTIVYKYVQSIIKNSEYDLFDSIEKVYEP